MKSKVKDFLPQKCHETCYDWFSQWVEQWVDEDTPLRAREVALLKGFEAWLETEISAEAEEVKPLTMYRKQGEVVKYCGFCGTKIDWRNEDGAS